MRVLIADDHGLFRKGVHNAIEHEEGIQVVGEAEDGMEALARAKELKPDLILLDPHMPHGDGLEVISAIKKELPDTKIIVLTIHDDDNHLFEAIKKGADGFLSKNLRRQALLDSMKGVMKGEAAFSGRMIAKVLKELAELT